MSGAKRCANHFDYLPNCVLAATAIDPLIETGREKEFCSAVRWLESNFKLLTELCEDAEEVSG